MSRIPPSTQEMITTASRAAVKTQLKTLCCQMDPRTPSSTLFIILYLLKLILNWMYSTFILQNHSSI